MTARHTTRRAPSLAPVLARLDAHDRALLAALAGAPRTARGRAVWCAVTHLGGALATTLACALPLLLGALHRGFLWRAGLVTTATVLLSHGVVQLVKRRVARPRPAPDAAHVAAPDRFSFPSGHAAAALSVALGYALLAPALLPLLALAAVVVGLSRVVLGVHYLGDVLAGQALAALAYVLVLRALPA